MPEKKRKLSDLSKKAMSSKKAEKVKGGQKLKASLLGRRRVF
jgi:hypothetical protein